MLEDILTVVFHFKEKICSLLVVLVFLLEAFLQDHKE
jgi:hypothetical protein